MRTSSICHKRIGEDLIGCRIEVTFKDEKDSSSKSVRVPLGTSLLEAAHENDIDLEGEILPMRCLFADLTLG